MSDLPFGKRCEWAIKILEKYTDELSRKLVAEEIEEEEYKVLLKDLSYMIDVLKSAQIVMPSAIKINQAMQKARVASKQVEHRGLTARSEWKI